MFEMLKIFKGNIRNYINFHHGSRFSTHYGDKSNLPLQADVVVIGGGVAGCYTVYNLAKQGVSAVLLERSKLTAGTTWHTNGLMWRIRPSDVDIQLLNRTRDIVLDIKNNTDLDPGWIQNGGLFIARNENRLNEYLRLSTIAKVYDIEHSMLSAKETTDIFPLLNKDRFVGSLFSPGDGIIDPTSLCNALTKLSKRTGKAKIYENCCVDKILTESKQSGKSSVIGVETNRGIIKTNCVVNATGVWGRDLIEQYSITIPLIPMRHSYIATEAIDGIQGMPNIRDHDASIALRIQGSSVYLGGYEKNPIILDKVESDFNFSLYDLDWSTFEDHVKGAEELLPKFSSVGIKCTVCGPESFTPDHKPILGPDPRLIGLFHNCGYNSAGMMYSGGTGEQLTQWILHGRPDYYMQQFDIKRFTPRQLSDQRWSRERSHESYAENYSMVFLNAQPLAGRNFNKCPLHDDMISNGAFMEERHGFERPSFFHGEKLRVDIPLYDWHGAYGNTLNADSDYMRLLRGDLKYEFSDHLEKIGAEALSCRTNAAIFNLSSSCKLYISGRHAKKALEWICTADIDKPPNSVVNSAALNDRSGIEAVFTVYILKEGEINLGVSQFEDDGYLIVSDGAFAHNTVTHIAEGIAEKEFDVIINDVTDCFGILSIQGPNSRRIIQELIDEDLNAEMLQKDQSKFIDLPNSEANGRIPVRISPARMVGEVGYELLVQDKNCSNVYNHVMKIGANYNISNAGYRALNSLACEKGIPLWGFDVRSDDTIIESNLISLCRQNSIYRGSDVVEKQKLNGIKKRLVYLTLERPIPMWGLEGVYRNGQAVGFIRRADYGYSIKKPIGACYIKRNDCHTIDDEYLMNAEYAIEVLGKRYPANIHINSVLQ